MMKHVIAIVAVLLVSAVPRATAQDVDRERAEQGRERLEQMKDRLRLTPEQVERVRPVLIDEMQQLKALRDRRSNGSPSRRDRFKLAREARGIQDKADEQLKTILTKDQMKELKKIRDERRRQAQTRVGQA